MNILKRIKAFIYGLSIRNCALCGNDCTFHFTCIDDISFCGYKCANDYKIGDKW